MYQRNNSRCIRFPSKANQRLLRAAAVGVFAFCVIAMRGSGDNVISVCVNVKPADLLVRPTAANWLSYNGDYTGRRYSGLTQINPANVAQLKAQWVFHSPNSNHLEGTPVVVDGLMLSRRPTMLLLSMLEPAAWSGIIRAPVTEGLVDDASSHHNRGVGVGDSRVYMQTDNAHLLCLDARSGHLMWDVAYAPGT